MINPELVKNVKIELTLPRLIIMPIVISIIFWTAYLSCDEVSEFIIKAQTVAIILIGVIVFLGGNKIVSESVINEVNNRTWISQKMTSISIGRMLIGKVIGSTIYTWYGALFCVIAFIVTIFYQDNSVGQFKFLILVLLLGIFSQSSTLLLSFISIKRNSNKANLQSTIYFIIGTSVSLFMLYYAKQFFDEQTIRLKWHFFEVGFLDFAIFSILFFNIWSFIGLYRSMREEMQYENGSIVWYIFLISCIFYLTGFTVNFDFDFIDTVLGYMMIAMFFVIVVTYMMAFSEPKNIIDYKIVLSKFRQRQWNEFQIKVPVWFLNLLLLALVLLVIYGLVVYTVVANKLTSLGFLSYFLPLNIFLFVIRDLGVILFVNFSGKMKRPDLVSFLFLLILYVLIPTIFSFSGLREALPFFIPVPKIALAKQNFFTATLPVIIQCVVIGYFVIRLWRQKSKVLS